MPTSDPLPAPPSENLLTRLLIAEAEAEEAQFYADAKLGAALRAALADGPRYGDQLLIERHQNGFDVRMNQCGAAALEQESDATRTLAALLGSTPSPSSQDGGG